MRSVERETEKEHYAVQLGGRAVVAYDHFRTRCDC